MNTPPAPPHRVTGDMSDEAKSTAISNLVQQLKDGQISKNELFSQLSKFQQEQQPQQPAMNHEGSVQGVSDVSSVPFTPSAKTRAAALFV